MKHPDRIISDNLKAEAVRAYQAAEQHRIYSEQARSVGSAPLKEAHDRVADAYAFLGERLDDRAVEFAEAAKTGGG